MEHGSASSFVTVANEITNIAGIIREHGRERADKPALILGDKKMTWDFLYSRSCQMAQALQAAGVGSQDRVAFLDKNSIEHFEVFYGCALLNAVSVDINWRLAPPEVAFIVNDTQAKVFIVGPDFVPVLDAIAEQLTFAKTIIVIGGHAKYEDYESFVGRQAAIDPGVDAGPDDVAFQLYSSGTTGRPKGVMLTSNNFFALLPMAKTRWKLNAESVNLVAMPLFHIGGGGWATAGQYVGAASVIVRDIDPSALVKLFGQQGITHGFVVPALLQFTLMVPDIDKADFSSLKLIVYGASPISDEVLAKSIKAYKCDFMQVYGLTDTTGVVTMLMPEDHDIDGPNKHRLRSCGKPSPGVELRIVDAESNTDVPLGEVGEIWLRTSQIMKGYWNMAEATAEVIVDGGWFRSGDIGYLDEDGYCYIFDRVKDMVVSGGENIYPAEVENALMAHPAVADVAVIGVPDEKWGEVPMAVVVRQKDVAVTEQEIIDFAKTRLASFKCPKSVVWAESLPRNPSGKILKKDIRAPYWVGRTRLVN